MTGPAEDSGWTFLTNHAHVLILIHQNPDRVLREIANEVGITERAVQRIVHDLVEAKYLVRTKVGRCNHYRVNARRKLRHHIEAHCSVGDLFELAVPKKRSAKKS